MAGCQIRIADYKRKSKKQFSSINHAKVSCSIVNGLLFAVDIKVSQGYQRLQAETGRLNYCCN
ncbi:MAG TPA: hypothetical protein VHO70_06715 [Chitinispirillaceae bacterium]|nr:hypothetical protein [Chitinispirillaceae bacterium]